MIPRNLAVKLLRSWSKVTDAAPLQSLAGVELYRRGISCHSASVTKIHRLTYARVYPTVVVLPDGSSINIRYHEPRKVIKLPLDLSKMSEAERKLRLERRKPKKKIVVEEEIDDNFDASKYVNLINK